MSEAEAARLCQMAGQIAGFFHAYPEAEAVSGIAAHINQFWTPHMRAALLAADPGGLDPLVRRALALVHGAPAREITE